MNKRISEIKDRVEVVKDESKSQTNESLKALTNDISIILKPCIRIADQIASECIQARQDIPYLLEEIEKRDRALENIVRAQDQIHHLIYSCEQYDKVGKEKMAIVKILPPLCKALSILGGSDERAEN